MPIITTIDEVQKLKQQLENNIVSLEKQRTDLTSEYNNKIAGIDNQLLDFNDKLKEVLKYKKIGQL